MVTVVAVGINCSAGRSIRKWQALFSVAIQRGEVSSLLCGCCTIASTPCRKQNYAFHLNCSVGWSSVAPCRTGSVYKVLTVAPCVLSKRLLCRINRIKQQWCAYIRNAKCNFAVAGGYVLSGWGRTSDCDRPSLEIRGGRQHWLESVKCVLSLHDSSTLGGDWACRVLGDGQEQREIPRVWREEPQLLLQR